MNHTVVLDEAERDRRMVNHLNEILRHCRIGRVSPNAKPVTMPFRPGQPFIGWPSSPIDDLFRRQYVPTFSSGGTADVPIVPTHGVMM